MLFDKVIYSKVSNRFGTKLVKTGQTVSDELFTIVVKAVTFIKSKSRRYKLLIRKHGIGFFVQTTKKLTKVGWYFNKLGRIFINANILTKFSEVCKKYVFAVKKRLEKFLIAIIVHESIHAEQHDNGKAPSEIGAWAEEYCFMESSFGLTRTERFFYFSKFKRFTL